MTSTLRLSLWRAAAAASTLVILSTLLLPADRLPSTSLGGADKIAHAILFFVWSLTCHRSGLRTWRLLVLGLALAVSTEAGQWLMGVGRTADHADVAADLVGIVLGATASKAVPARGPDRT